MEYLQRGLMSHDLDPGGVKPLDASVPRASGEVAGLGPSRNPSSSMCVYVCVCCPLWVSLELTSVTRKLRETAPHSHSSSHPAGGDACGAGVRCR